MDDWVNDKSFFGVSELGREVIAKDFFPPSNYNKHKGLSIILNIIVATGVSFFFNFNLIAFAISFVIFDIVMGFVDNIIFNYIPKMRVEKISIMPLDEREKYVEKLKIKVEELEKKAEKYRKENCDRCTYFSYYSNSCKSTSSTKSCSLVFDDLNFFRNLWREQNKILTLERKKMEEELLEKETPVSRDFKDKIEYFSTLRKKYVYFVEEKNMNYLSSIVVSLDKLITKLNDKPFALQLVPKSLYIYLDELQNVLNKVQGLDNERQERYLRDIEKISEALGYNIEALNQRIDRFETGDIEDTLNTLLNELVKGNKEDGDV